MISVVSSPDYEPRGTGLTKQSYHGPQTFTRSLSQGVWPAKLSDLHVKRIVESQNGAGATWYWSDQEVSMIVLESKNGNKGTLHQKSDNNFCATHTLRMRILVSLYCMYHFLLHDTHTLHNTILLALSPGPSQILSRSHGEKSGEGLGSKLHHGLEMVDSVSTNRVHVTY